MTWAMVDLHGQVAFTMVPCRFPPINHFQRIAGAHDWDLLDAVEAMTDEQARDEIGQIELVPVNDRLRGVHTAPVMAAFTRFDPAGSLFSDGSYGVLYLQMQRDAAICKGKRDACAFLAATAQKPIKLQLGLYAVGLAGAVADLRQTELLRGTDRIGDISAASRHIGERLRTAGIAGAMYRDTSGADNLAVLRAGALTNCVPRAYIELSWNGTAIDSESMLSTTQEPV